MSIISFVEGTPGNGKSLYSVNRGMRLLARGGVLACNFPLSADWALTYAQRQKPYAKEVDQVSLACDYYNRAFRFGTVESLYDLSKLIPFLVTGKALKKREGKALALFDECSLLFNSRDWQKNFPYIVFFINARKLKFHCLLMSHSHEDVDIQIQRKCELLISLRCMTKLKFAGFEFGHFLKKPYFRLISTIAGAGAGKGVKEDKMWFGLPLDTCDLYDTDHEFSFEDFQVPLGKLGKDPREAFEQKTQQQRTDALIKARAASVINYGSTDRYRAIAGTGQLNAIEEKKDEKLHVVSARVHCGYSDNDIADDSELCERFGNSQF